MSSDIVELNKCKLSKAPEYLPIQLKNHIQGIINAFAYADSNPYYSYFHKTSKYKYSPIKKMDEYGWDEYKKTLNRYNNVFDLISDDRMKYVWDKLYTKDNYNFGFFGFICVQYNELIKYQCRDALPRPNICNNIFEDLEEETVDKNTEEEKQSKNPNTKLDLFKEIRRHVKKNSSIEVSRELEIIFKNHTPLNNKESLEEFKYNLQCIESQLNSNWTVFAPDGADCFEDMDKNDPENQIYLDENGDIPYKINWDLYIKDEEMKTFRNILSKLIIKSGNRINLYNDEKSKIKEYLNNPMSRKKDVDGSCEIQLAKILYIRFMMELKQPLYAEIAIILEILFGSPYTYNDIVKFTKKPRDNIRKLKEKLKKEGAEHYFNDNFDEKSLID